MQFRAILPVQKTQRNMYDNFFPSIENREELCIRMCFSFFLFPPLKMGKNFVFGCVLLFLFRPLKMGRNFVFGCLLVF